MENQRNEPMYQYYVVTFRGSDFPLFMRDNQYIYRGSAFEKLAELSPQVESQFPDAIVFFIIFITFYNITLIILINLYSIRTKCLLYSDMHS